MLGVLVLLLFVPRIIKEVRIRRETRPAKPAKKAEPSGKVKLKEQSSTKRIKLK